MKRWVTVLCYNKNGQPAFERTNVFAAKDYGDACHKGEALLDENYPLAVRDGYNNWTLDVDALMTEAARVG